MIRKFLRWFRLRRLDRHYAKVALLEAKMWPDMRVINRRIAFSRITVRMIGNLAVSRSQRRRYQRELAGL